MTLIEVVAAIAILGTILVGVVVAKARHTHQLALAEQRDAAVRAADELLSGWWADRRNIPMDAEGVLAARPVMKWRTQWVDNREIEELGARVVRLEVRDEGEQSVVVVDLVVPVAEEKKTGEGQP